MWLSHTCTPGGLLPIFPGMEILPMVGSSCLLPAQISPNTCHLTPYARYWPMNLREPCKGISMCTHCHSEALLLPLLLTLLASQCSVYQPEDWTNWFIPQLS